MSEFSELERLLIEKKKLEAKIRAIKAPVYIRCGLVKIEKKKQESGSWQVCAMTEYDKTEYESREAYEARMELSGEKFNNWYYGERKQIGTYKATRWWPFIREDTKEDALKTIQAIAHDLRELAKQLKKQQDVAETTESKGKKEEEEIPFEDSLDDVSEDFSLEDLAGLDSDEEE